MKKLITLLSFAAFIAGNAHASRQVVSCRNRDGYRVSANFNPTKSTETLWVKDENDREVIKTIKLGLKETKTTTTARVYITVPSTEFKAPYASRFLLESFYEVNIFNKAGSGYSYKFNDGAYQSFHGHDKNQLWDMMFYFDNSALNENKSSFKGLITIQMDTIQMDMLDEGYYHIDLDCSSKLQ